MQIAFRVQTDAAILGAGIVLAGGADIYPAPPATPRHHPPRRQEAMRGKAKLTASFAPKDTKCNLRFASMAQRHGFFGVRASTEFCPTGQHPLPLS
jgi:hypothetical protein